MNAIDNIDIISLETFTTSTPPRNSLLKVPHSITSFVRISLSIFTPMVLRSVSKRFGGFLKSDGIFRISVPDLDKIVAGYDRSRADEFCQGVFETRQKRDKNQHHWHYNEISLERILREIGFRKVHRCQFREGRCADVQTIDNRPESLFIEAAK